MSDVAIRVENLGKMYRLGARQARYKRLTETLADALTAPVRRMRNWGKPTPSSETIWALRDVSFEVKRGEVLGVIGRNGAGKSTLLKILARITEPSEGEAEIHGRAGALLEVGTGFHPELTGRENIYLSSTILGMRRVEVERKFDEIVAFAEIEKFLDTPVKRYSSGMYVRLAFAVAVHLEPEVLLVDEVLAVGDAGFQKKCLEKLEAVAREGRTVLYVSHNMTTVESLCSRAIILEKGLVDFCGPTGNAIKHYFRVTENRTFADGIDMRDHPGRRYGCKPIIRQIRVLTSEGQDSTVINVGSPVIFDFYLDPGEEKFNDCAVGMSVFNMHGQLVVNFRSYLQHPDPWSLDRPLHIKLTWDECTITPGLYKATVAFGTVERSADWIDHALDIEVRVQANYGVGQNTFDTLGIVVPHASWQIGEE